MCYNKHVTNIKILFAQKTYYYDTLLYTHYITLFDYYEFMTHYFTYTIIYTETLLFTQKHYYLQTYLQINQVSTRYIRT